MASYTERFGQVQHKWDNFPLPKAGTLETSRGLRNAAITSLFFTALSGAATTYVAIAFTATPIVVASTFCGLALLTIALSVASIYFWNKAPSERDPEICKQRARAAGKHIQSRGLGFDDIKDQYPDLINLNRINLEVIRDMLKHDVSELTYAGFTTQHCRINGIQAAYDFMTNESKQILKTSYVSYIGSLAAQAKDLIGFKKDTLESFDANFLCLKEEELNQMLANRLHTDAEKLSFKAFRDLHSLDKMAVYLLSETKAILKDKYLQHLESIAAKTSGIRVTYDDSAVKTLGVTFAEVASRLANSEATKAQSYAGFVRDNTREALKYVADTALKDKLKALFLSELEAKTNTEDLGGVANVVTTFAAEHSAFGGDIPTLVGEIVFKGEKQKFLDGKIDYASFRNRNTLAWLQGSVKSGSQEYRDELKDGFLSLPEEKIKSAEYAEDRRMLNIGEDLVEEHYQLVNRKALKLTYFEFKAKFGMNLLLKEKLCHERVQTYKEELTKDLIKSPLDQMDALKIDMKCLGIEREAILKQRWTANTLLAIVQAERKTFFAEALSVFTREELVIKVLSEVPTIAQIVQHYPEFFKQKLLLPHDALNGQSSVSTRMESEIADMSTLDQLFKLNAKLIFDYQLISNDNKKLNALILQFMAANARELLTSGLNFETQRILTTLNDCERVPTATDKPLIAGRKAVRQEVERNAARLLVICKDYEEAISKAEAKANADVKQATQDADLTTYKSRVEAASQYKEATERTLKAQTQAVANKRAALSQAQASQQSLRNRQSALRQEQTNLMSVVGRFSGIQHNLQQERLGLQRLQNEQAASIRQETFALEQQLKAQESLLLEARGRLASISRAYNHESLKKQRADAQQKHTTQSKALEGLRAKLEKAKSETNPQRLTALDALFKDEKSKATGLGETLSHFAKSKERSEWNTLRAKAEAVRDLEGELAKLGPAVFTLKQEYDRLELSCGEAEIAMAQTNSHINEIVKQIQQMRSNKARVEENIRRKYNFQASEALIKRYERDAMDAQNASQRNSDVSAELDHMIPQITQAALAVAQLPLEIASAEVERLQAEKMDHQAQSKLTAAITEHRSRETILSGQKRTAEEEFNSAKSVAEAYRATQMQSENALHQANISNIVETFKSAITETH